MGAAGSRLRPEGPFLFDESVSRYQHSPDELVNRYDGEVYRRVIEVGDALVLVEARDAGMYGGARGEAGTGPAGTGNADTGEVETGEVDAGAVDMRVRAPGRMSKKLLGAGEAALRHLLAFDLDLEPFYRMARRDPVLAPFARRFRGLRPVRYLTLFEALITAITTQQVNLTFGGQTRARLVKRWGEKLLLEDEVHWAFPRPERLARARAATLKGMQFSGRKAEYVIGVARAAAEGGLEADDYRKLPLEEAVERLTALRGVGRWSAEQALYRALGRIDALPGGDLGVQKVVAQYCFGEVRVDECRAREAALGWKPWGALASAYLFAARRAGIPAKGD